MTYARRTGRDHSQFRPRSTARLRSSACAYVCDMSVRYRTDGPHSACGLSTLGALANRPGAYVDVPYLEARGHGVSVSLTIMDAGFVVGGQYGKGSLRVADHTVGSNRCDAAH